MKIETQLNIGIENNPGSLARMSDILRAADVNIEALFCTDGEKQTVVHLIVDDVETAKMVLRPIGEMTVAEVLAIPVKNTPGAIAQIARRCAGAQINIRHIYATSLGKDAMVYLGCDDIKRAMEALK